MRVNIYMAGVGNISVYKKKKKKKKILDYYKTLCAIITTFVFFSMNW